MDNRKENEIVGSLYGTEYFGNSSQTAGSGRPRSNASNENALLTKFIVLILSIIIICVMTQCENERQEAAYHEMVRNMYKGSKKSSNQSSTTTKKNTTTKKSTTTTKKSSSESSDRLNAKDYRDPEDFYDDNYDDFFDYEDAEDYYYANGGK